MPRLVGTISTSSIYLLATIHRADLILLMENRRVIERGTYEELMNARRAYHGMVLRQMESHGHEGEQMLRE